MNKILTIMHKNLSCLGFSLAMGFLLIACGNDPALEKQDQNLKQKLEQISTEIPRLEKGIKEEIVQLADKKGDTAEQLEMMLQGGRKSRVEFYIQLAKQEEEKNSGDAKKSIQSEIKILNNILEKRIQIDKQKAARRKLAA